MLTKYDFLVTEVCDKIVKCVDFLQKDNKIDNKLSLREVYNKYLHPNILPLDEKKIWDNIQNGSILNVFQFDSMVGAQAVKKIKPTNIQELTDCNGLMRLMTAEKGEESPIDKYVRFKNNIKLWYNEMNMAGLTKDEQKSLEPYFLSSYGVPPSQEQLMLMLMDENLCNFSLKDANDARKIVGKKQMSRIPELQDKVVNRASSKNLGLYIWRHGVGPQMGYAFSIIHSTAYSIIGFQTAYLATRWDPIYWNTACLVVNSGSLEDENDIEYEIEENEDGEKIIKKEKSTDYAKIAVALGDIISRGIKVSLIDINKSAYSFEPDVENNQILFGMKALNGVGAPIIEQIIANRPYVSFADVMNRCPVNKTAMISLIKAGAFDNLELDWAKELNVEPRYLIMTYYLSRTCEPKKRLTLQNFNGLVQKNLIPKSLDFQKKVFLFNKHLKANKKVGKYYVFDLPEERFYALHFSVEFLNVINGVVCILQTDWDKIYKKQMDAAREWLKENQESVLKEFNELLFHEEWHKYAEGSLSSWEMESLCFYYHEHELAHVNKNKYGIVNFFDLPEQPEVDYFFKRNGKEIPIYKTTKIIGTVISKNDTRSSIAILTTDGVVNVKFTKEYFAMFNRQISAVQPDGTKKVMEKGWMTRGTKLLINGFRREDLFICKKYKNTGGHQLYKITEVKDNGEIVLTHERYKGENNGE